MLLIVVGMLSLNLFSAGFFVLFPFTFHFADGSFSRFLLDWLEEWIFCLISLDKLFVECILFRCFSDYRRFALSTFCVSDLGPVREKYVISKGEKRILDVDWSHFFASYQIDLKNSFFASLLWINSSSIEFFSGVSVIIADMLFLRSLCVSDLGPVRGKGLSYLKGCIRNSCCWFKPTRSWLQGTR